VSRRHSRALDGPSTVVHAGPLLPLAPDARRLNPAAERGL